MNFEEMQVKWAALESRCERWIGVLENAQREQVVRRAQWMSGLHAIWPVLDLVFGLAVSLLAGGFVVSHWPSMGSVLPASCVWLAGSALMGVSIYQLVLLGRLSWGESVVATQRRILRLKSVSIQHLKWVLLFAPLAGFTFLMTAFEAATGKPLWGRFDTAWIVGNVVFGVVWIPLGWLLARKVAHRFGDTGWFQRAVHAISGRSLARLERQAQRLREFTATE